MSGFSLAVGFVGGFLYAGFLFGTARLCGLNARRENEAVDAERISQ